MSRGIQHVFLVWYSWYSEGDAKPDHGDVLSSFIRALCDEKFRFFAQAAFRLEPCSGAKVLVCSY